MVPEALRRLCVVVQTMADVYPGGEDKRVSDAVGSGMAMWRVVWH
jgi:hypothetical protein